MCKNFWCDNCKKEVDVEMIVTAKELTWSIISNFSLKTTYDLECKNCANTLHTHTVRKRIKDDRRSNSYITSTY